MEEIELKKIIEAEKRMAHKDEYGAIAI